MIEPMVIPTLFPELFQESGHGPSLESDRSSARLASAYSHVSTWSRFGTMVWRSLLNERGAGIVTPANERQDLVVGPRRRQRHQHLRVDPRGRDPGAARDGRSGLAIRRRQLFLSAPF